MEQRQLRASGHCSGFGRVGTEVGRVGFPSVPGSHIPLLWSSPEPQIEVPPSFLQAPGRTCSIPLSCSESRSLVLGPGSPFPCKPGYSWLLERSHSQLLPFSGSLCSLLFCISGPCCLSSTACSGITYLSLVTGSALPCSWLLP